MTRLQLTPLEAARWIFHKSYCDRLRGNSRSCSGVPYDTPSVFNLKADLMASLNSDNNKRPLSELVP